MWQAIWSDLKENFNVSWTFALACPILFLIPALVEFGQHVVEIQAGMYDNIDGFRAAADNRERLIWGFAKIGSILLPGYWFTRYIMTNRDVAAARRVEWPALGMWAIYLFAMMGVMALLLFGGAMDQLANASSESKRVVLALFLALVMGTTYLFPFLAALPLGNRTIGLVASVRMVHSNFWAVNMHITAMLAVIMALIALHYGFAYAAMGQPPWLLWLLMGLDSILVAYIALIFAGSNALSARYAARLSGEPLWHDTSVAATDMPD